MEGKRIVNHLLEEYFKRDLTESEEEQLAQWLSSHGDDAQRFIGLMEAHYRTLGLPEPGWTEKPLPRFFPKPFYRRIWFKALCVLVLASSGYLAYRWWFRAQAPALSPSPAPALTPASSPKPFRNNNPASPVRSSRRKTRMELSISVDNPKTGLVTVKVLDGSGKEIRILFAGIMPAGQRTFQWDGKGENSLVAPAGDYRLEVTSGQTVMRKAVHLGAAN